MIGQSLVVQTLSLSFPLLTILSVKVYGYIYTRQKQTRKKNKKINNK